MGITDVKVVINLTTPVREQGFGFPLLLESGVETAKNYAEYASLAAIVEAGYENTSKVYQLANLIFMQENAPEKIAICSTSDTALAWLQDELNVSKDWRQLILANETVEIAEAISISDCVETLQGKMFYFDVTPLVSIVDGAVVLAYNHGEITSGGENVQTTLNGRKRTVLIYGINSNASVVGETAGRKVGSFTYKNLIVKGVVPTDLSSTQLETLTEGNTLAIVKKAGDIVTSEGITSSGEYIDVVDSEDYIIQQITYRTQKLLNGSAKIPYDNNGIAMLETVTNNVLQECYNNGMIADNEDGSPAFSVNFTKRENTNETDISARKYIGGQFTFKIAGAIHEVEITGEITL